MKKINTAVFAVAVLIASLGSVAQAATLGYAPGTRRLATPTSTQTPSEHESITRFEVTGLSSGALFFTDSGHVGLLGAGVAYQVAPGIQAALTALYLTVGNSKANVWAIAGLIGPVVNFPLQTDLRETFFASAKYGAGKIGGSDLSTSTQNDNSRGIWALSAGKHFKLTESISYSPEVGVSHLIGGSTPTSSLYRISPLAFSLMF